MQWVGHTLSIRLYGTITGLALVHIVYGIPGTPDLELKQPFDHFEASGSLSLTSDITAQPTASLLVRGLLVGDTLSLGGQPGGLWGLFTSYDFIAPNVFRVQGFGLGPGVSLMKFTSAIRCRMTRAS